MVVDEAAAAGAGAGAAAASSTGCSQPEDRRRMSCLNASSCSPRIFFLTILVLCSVLFILHLVPQPDFLDGASGAEPRNKLADRFGRIIGPFKSDGRDAEIESMAEKLRISIAYHPLKDLCYANNAQEGHSSFMSTFNDTNVEGEGQHLRFPSEASQGRVLCIKGRDPYNGTRNHYGLAWSGFLPRNATFREGLTFIANNRYTYDNIWHGLSAMVPFVGWHEKNGCRRPSRWVLYHKGEIRDHTAPWLELLFSATFGRPLTIDAFIDGVNNEGPVCFEEAVVMRHDEVGMSTQRRMVAYDLVRCQARRYCNVSAEDRPVVGMTMLLRTGERSFKDDVSVIEIFRKECSKFKDCRLTVAYARNLSVCEQVELMSRTDILVSPHGAQLTNMFLMDRNSSVMEFFPKGWLNLAGFGQYVYHMMAACSGMRHQGAWRDPDGDPCPHPEDDRQCFGFYKTGRIGHNQTYFAEWAGKVLNEVVSMKAEHVIAKTNASSPVSCSCG